MSMDEKVIVNWKGHCWSKKNKIVEERGETNERNDWGCSTIGQPDWQRNLFLKLQKYRNQTTQILNALHGVISKNFAQKRKEKPSVLNVFWFA